MSLYKLPGSTNDLEQAQARRHAADIQVSDDEGPPRSDASSSTGEDNDENWDDWKADSGDERSCLSLFDNTSLPNAAAILKYDTEKYGVNLEAISRRLGLDFHGRARLINYIRKEKPKSAEVNALTGKEPFFTSDTYLLPVVSDDPLLRFESDDLSDSDSEDLSSLNDKDKLIRNLTRKLSQVKQDLADYRSLVGNRLPELVQELKEEDNGSSSKEITTKRDDDSHYFESYGMNEIHVVMIRDKVRTSTYASFIMNSPGLFRDAVVLDVGCGTGVLSLFAARAGAKRVFAVDASDSIVEKAEKIVKTNNFEDIITVIKGKVEDITLPDNITHVDVIVSEWMGYALLYESMLDSVLVARDRFLKPKPADADEERGREGREGKGGVMVPSQTRMLLGLCSGSDIVKERIEFWSDVYGYDMSAMAENVYDEAVVDIVGPDTMLSDPIIIKDINIASVTQRQLSFSAPFELRGTNPRRQVAHAFILYFDAFFSASGEQVPSDRQALTVKEGDVVLAEVWRVGSPSTERARSPVSKSPTSPSRDRLRRASSFKSREKDAPKDQVKSFTTGPQSIPTHWKQTFFLLREPILVQEGTVVSGTFHCRKSSDNSRELDVELHYVVRNSDGTTAKDGPADDGTMIVQSYKVR